MTKILISPSGNREIWADDATPEGYCTPEQWALAHPAPPPPPIPLDQAQAAKQAEINGEKDRRIDAGVLFGGIRYDSDATAQARITGKSADIIATLLSGGAPQPVEWLAMDNGRRTIPASDFIALGRAIINRVGECVFTAGVHKNVIDGMTDAEAVMAYDFSEGWPE